MERNHQILILLIIGIVIVLYAFLTLQWLLGIVAAVIIIIAILIIPSIEQWLKSH
jgi:uncharacterized ion transporter superfamily protein YfcC